MKTINEIKKITQKVVEEKAEKKRIAEIKAKEQAKKEHEEMIKSAKDVSWYSEKIEEAAKNGKNECCVCVGAKNDSEYFTLVIKSIKKSLKDFNPQFEDKQEVSYDYNWEGGRIDGSEEYYTATYVHFNW